MELVDAESSGPTASGVCASGTRLPGNSELGSATDLIPELAPRSLTAGATGRRQWWRVSCRDVVNRQRFLTVILDRDRVVLLGPPGETAVLSGQQLDQLRATLRQAAAQAER